jgi:hypothetical protein
VSFFVVPVFVLDDMELPSQCIRSQLYTIYNTLPFNFGGMSSGKQEGGADDMKENEESRS